MEQIQAPTASLLVVEDNTINRTMLVRYVKKQGYQVTEAENGRQALEKLAAQRFDLVLLDIDMPEMNGYEVLTRIKTDPKLRELPVIMISALGDLDSVVRCIEIGAEDYLPKPFNPVLLGARLNSSLERKRWRDQELEYLEQVKHLTSAAEALEQDEFQPETLTQVAQRQDKLGQLARVFLRLTEHFYLREARLRHQLQEMRLEIALADPKEPAASAGISDTKAFKELEQKVFELVDKIKSSTQI